MSASIKLRIAFRSPNNDESNKWLVSYGVTPHQLLDPSEQFDFTDGGYLRFDEVMGDEEGELIWERWTGLLDKEDKEIYEGDILKCDGVPLGWGDAYHTVYASVVRDSETGGFRASCGIYGRHGDNSPRHFWRYEVIGNIHEHTHLLT